MEQIRSVYRFAEFASGVGGYLSNHEWNFYVFEAAIILPVLVTYNFFHPAQYLTNIGWRQNREGKGSANGAGWTSDGAELL